MIDENVSSPEVGVPRGVPLPEKLRPGVHHALIILAFQITAE
jgi:hypothetical protein